MIVVSSLYANPLHIGHIEYLYLAKQLLPPDSFNTVNKHISIVNNDKQCELKQSIFMSQEDRLCIVRNLKMVDEAMLSIDEDATVCQTLINVRHFYPYEEIIFAKGGDRFAYEIPEAEVCRYHNIRIVDGLGKKIRNSSCYRERHEV